ncbi:hypothetical protein AUP68_09876 [Ilyonectria robusta]
MSYERLVVARRKPQANQSVAFEVMKEQEVLETEDRIKVTGLSNIDGEYILLAMREKNPEEGDEYGGGENRSEGSTPLYYSL